jgi:hypothetical protein
MASRSSSQCHQQAGLGPRARRRSGLRVDAGPAVWPVRRSAPSEAPVQALVLRIMPRIRVQPYQAPADQARRNGPRGARVIVKPDNAPCLSALGLAVFANSVARKAARTCASVGIEACQSGIPDYPDTMSTDALARQRLLPRENRNGRREARGSKTKYAGTKGGDIFHPPFAAVAAQVFSNADQRKWPFAARRRFSACPIGRS